LETQKCCLFILIHKVFFSPFFCVPSCCESVEDADLTFFRAFKAGLLGLIGCPVHPTGQPPQCSSWPSHLARVLWLLNPSLPKPYHNFGHIDSVSMHKLGTVERAQISESDESASPYELHTCCQVIGNLFLL
jgi:hypothetical protein